MSWILLPGRFVIFLLVSGDNLILWDFVVAMWKPALTGLLVYMVMAIVMFRAADAVKQFVRDVHTVAEQVRKGG